MVEELEELRRRATYQVEENRHFQTQAARLLRIILTGLSVMVAGLSVAITSATFPSISTIVSSESLGYLGSQLDKFTILDKVQARTIAIFLLYFAAISILVSIKYLVRDVPYYAYLVLAPDIVEPAAGAEDLDRDLDKKTFSEIYLAIIESNEEIITKSRRNLERCYESLKHGLLLLSLGLLLGVVEFIIKDEWLAIISFASTIIIFGFYMMKNIALDDLYIYRPNIWIDGGKVPLLLILLISSNGNAGVLPSLWTFEGIAFVVILAAIGWRALELEEERMVAIGERLIVEAIAVFLVVVSLFIATSGVNVYETIYSPLTGILAIYLITLLFISSLFAATLVAKRSIISVYRWISEKEWMSSLTRLKERIIDD